MDSDLQKEGAITFWLRHQHRDWSKNSSTYSFPSVIQEGLTIEAIKHPDKTIEINIKGLGDYPLQFIKPIPKCDHRGLFVSLEWQIGILSLYLNTEYAGYVEILRIH